MKSSVVEFSSKEIYYLLPTVNIQRHLAGCCWKQGVGLNGLWSDPAKQITVYILLRAVWQHSQMDNYVRTNTKKASFPGTGRYHWDASLRILMPPGW